MKLTRGEQTVLSMAKLQGYDVYRCDTHGLYPVSPDFSTKCPFCKKECDKYEE